MKLMNALVAVAALSAGVAMANNHAGDCKDKKGAVLKVKDKAACEKKLGTWTEAAAAAAPAAAAEAAAPAAAPATAPAEAAPHK